MRTALLVNLVVAVTTFTACLMAPWYMEWSALRQDLEAQLGAPSPLSPDLSLQTSAVSVSAMFLPNSVERMEAARRARVWMQSLHVCKGNTRPSWCNVNRGLTAATVVRQLVLASAQTPRHGTTAPQVLLQTSSWMGSVAVELLLLNQVVEGFVAAVGSASSCQMFTSHYKHHVAQVHCVDVESDPHAREWVELGKVGSFEGCSTRAACVAKRMSDDSALLSVGKGEMNSPSIVVLDFDAGLGVLAASSLMAALRATNSVGKHQLATIVHWQPPTTQRGRRLLHDYWASLQRKNESLITELFPLFVVHALHGECSSVSPIPFAEFASHYLGVRPSAPEDDDGATHYPSSCIFIARLAQADHLLPLSSILQNDVKSLHGTTPFHRSGGVSLKAPTAVPFGAMDVFLIGIAVVVGVALCYGVSKNWFGRKRRVVTGVV